MASASTTAPTPAAGTAPVASPTPAGGSPQRPAGGAAAPPASPHPASAPASPIPEPLDHGQDQSRDEKGRFTGTVRPIPPRRTSLPGVIAEDDDTPIGAKPVESRMARLGKPSAEKAAEGAPETAIEQPVTPSEAPPQKFKFAGRDWDSQEKAESAHRTLQGHFKQFQSERDAARKDAEDRDRIARNWMAEAEARQKKYEAAVARLQAAGIATDDVAPLSSQSAPASTSPPAPSAYLKDGKFDAAKFLDEAVEWKLYDTIKQDHGPDVAQIWALESTVGKLYETISRQIEARFAPIQQHSEQMAVVGEAANVWRTMQDMRYPDGQPAYPELDNPESAAGIVDVWQQLDLTPQAKFTTRGAHVAVAVWRSLQAANQLSGGNGNGAVPGGAPPNPPTPPAPPTPQQLAAESAAAAVGSPGPTPVRSAVQGDAGTVLREQIRTSGEVLPGFRFRR